MKVDFVFKNSTPDKEYNSKFFEEMLLIGIKELKLGNKNIEVSVNLVGEDKIKELNSKYRHKDKVTDVLSFPMSKSSYLETRDKKQGGSKIIVSGRLSPVADLGDIFICLSIAKKEAKSENISIEKKLAQLTVHGFLHLTGHDHEKSDKDAKKMFDLEHKILAKSLKTKD